MKLTDTTTDKTARPEPADDRPPLRVGVAEYAVSTEGTVLKTSGLGSCVGVALYDVEAGVAGLAHVMLPAADGAGDDVGKYADTAIDALLEDVEAAGGNRADVVAKIAGGASMLGGTSIGSDVGPRNVEAVRQVLDGLGVPVVAADVGDSHGRSVEADPTTGALRIRAATGDEAVL